MWPHRKSISFPDFFIEFLHMKSSGDGILLLDLRVKAGFLISFDEFLS